MVTELERIEYVEDPHLGKGSYCDSIGDFCCLGTRLKAPAVIFGADWRNYHSKDEYVLLDSIHQTAQVVYRFLEQVLLG